MSRPHSATAQRDPLQALFLCLIVLAQLLLPTVFEQARAAEAGCVSLASASDSSKGSKQRPHAHAQECAHCRPQAVVLAPPVMHPEVTVAPTLETAVAHDGAALVVASLQPLPPATGPPVLLLSV